MAQAAVNVIGIIATLVTTIGFMQSNLRDQPNNTNSMVRIAAGKADGLSASEGTVPTIFAYNEQKGFIGQYGSDGSSPTIEAGSFLDVTIDQGVTDDNADRGSGQQPTYLQLIASNNAICIAYIAQTWSDGTKRDWVGDVGKACGQNWFHSDVFVGDDHHQPTCMWLDSDHTNDIASAGMQIHMEDFTNLTFDYSKDTNHYCNPPVSIFHKDANWRGFDLDTLALMKRGKIVSRGAKSYEHVKRWG